MAGSRERASRPLEENARLRAMEIGLTPSRSARIIELKEDPDVWRPIVKAARHGAVTLIYSSRDAAHNNAVALQEFLKVHQPRLR